MLGFFAHSVMLEKKHKHLICMQKAGDCDCGGNDINRGYCNENRSMAE